MDARLRLRKLRGGGKLGVELWSRVELRLPAGGPAVRSVKKKTPRRLAAQGNTRVAVRSHWEKS